MNDISIERDQTDEEMLTCEISDEALEVAGEAGTDPNYSAYQTISYPTWGSTCLCGC